MIISQADYEKLLEESNKQQFELLDNRQGGHDHEWMNSYTISCSTEGFVLTPLANGKGVEVYKLNDYNEPMHEFGKVKKDGRKTIHGALIIMILMLSSLFAPAQNKRIALLERQVDTLTNTVAQLRADLNNQIMAGSEALLGSIHTLFYAKDINARVDSLLATMRGQNEPWFLALQVHQLRDDVNVLDQSVAAFYPMMDSIEFKLRPRRKPKPVQTP